MLLNDWGNDVREELSNSLRREYILKNFIGCHPAFNQLLEKIKNLADKPVTILLQGETGTGKGRCAEFLHHYSDRFAGPFIPYNCGAGPTELFESQLFGYVKGAFTGADADRPGLVEDAHSGTLFLDEINSLSLHSQVKLNHFLETRMFRRVGDSRQRKVEVRIIAASNQDLCELVATGNFRKDLYYRLAEYEIFLPPLRHRKEDIPILAEYFLKKNMHLSSHKALKFAPRVMEPLLSYSWPGNIRELENCIKKGILEAQSEIIDRLPIPGNDSGEGRPASELELTALTWKEAKRRVIAHFEKIYLTCLLRRYQGVVAKCARHAGIHAPDFWKLMRKYDLKAADFRGTQ